jgi:peptidoglycan/xylan/chitin deacetylase (PgdA/CDA1 family)
MAVNLLTMSITRGDFLRSLGKSLPGVVASTVAATAAEALIRRLAPAAPAEGSRAEGAPAKGASESDIPFFTRGTGKGNEIALTFDDGPVPGVTELILDELKKRDLQATFFMIGRHVAAAPELARRVRDDGHEIGNHTFTHARLSGLSDGEADQELAETEKVFAELLDYKAAWFRPPFGAFRQNQAPLAAKRGLGVALWDVDAEDWRLSDPARIVQNIQTKTKAQSIILCHELSQTARCLDEVLDALQEKGFLFLTLSSFSCARSTGE